MRALRTLNLNNCRMGGHDLGTEGIQALGPSLARMSVLQRLALWGNQIDDNAATALSPHLAKMAELRCLDLRHNHIASAVGLAPFLAKLPALTELHLGSKPSRGLVNTLLSCRLCKCLIWISAQMMP